jgi:hypothetical protein
MILNISKNLILLTIIAVFCVSGTLLFADQEAPDSKVTFTVQ